ncbi:hypothetical protein [Rhizobium leguminosarum]|uniref:hypothetical protein n=1 Tax=Rhizobium leguminosarum TaxID=384 RepID=UPI0015DB93F7|nr:hypothetical protein [Rhizobium leguminosarum]NZD50573.1 hypothetical protein [Rhizobium leguminosarum]
MTEPHVDVWTPAGELTAIPHANDNVPADLRALGAAIGRVDQQRNSPLLIGITGKRNVGKSTVAGLLEQRYGFARAHAFDGGKEAALHYFAHIVGDIVYADRMVYGDLKDVSSPYLPGNAAPRFFLEKFGQFMGVEMGVEWTLAMEVARIRRETPNAPIVVESLVYEAPWFKAHGGFVLRLVRPDFEGPAGVESDKVQAGIAADETISALSVDELEDKTIRLVDRLFGGADLRRFG